MIGYFGHRLAEEIISSGRLLVRIAGPLPKDSIPLSPSSSGLLLHNSSQGKQTNRPISQSLGKQQILPANPEGLHEGQWSGKYQGC